MKAISSDQPQKPTREFMKQYGERRPTYKRPKDTRTKEQKAEDAQNRIYDRERRAEKKRYKEYVKEQKVLAKRELAILEYMKKTDVLHHHHGQKDSMQKEIDKQILIIKECLKIKNSDEGIYRPHSWAKEYDSYIWNYQGEGDNYMWRSLLHCLWRGGEFETIHDVPLNGEFIFYTYDSGERGLGSFDRMSVIHVSDIPTVPKVSPGSIIPITAR